MAPRGRGELRSANSRLVPDQITGQISPTKGPDYSLEQRNIELRKQQMINAIDGLNAFGKGVVDLGKGLMLQQAGKAAEKGRSEAIEGKESTADDDWLFGSSQQKAYNQTAAKVKAAEMPDAFMSYYQQKAEQPDFKPLEEMTAQERRSQYAEFKAEFMKSSNGKSYWGDLNIEADKTMDQHLSLISKQVSSFKQEQAIITVGRDAISTIESTLISTGSMAKVDEAIQANMNKWIAAAGTQAAAEQSILNNMVQLAAGLDDGKPKTNLAAYLQSPEARERFKKVKGFNKTVAQVTERVDKAVRAEQIQKAKAFEMEFYGHLNGGDFTTEKEFKEYLNKTTLDEKKKYELMNKAHKFLKDRSSAKSLEPFIRTGQAEVVNAAPEAVLEQAFGMQVAPVEHLNLAAMNKEQAANLVEWLNKGFNVPKFVSRFGENTFDNGEQGQKKLEEQSSLYSFLRSATPTNVGKIFPSQTIGKLELYNRLASDSTMTPQEIKNSLQAYDDAMQKNAAGISKHMEIQTELKQKDVAKSILKFSKDNSLQPWFTFGSMDAYSQEWASDAVSHSYKAYRLSGLPQEDALERAKSDFVDNNQWVNFSDGQRVFLPNDLGSDIENKAAEYLLTTGVLQKYALELDVPVESLRARSHVRPTRDYASTRQIELVIDGIPRDEKFTKVDLDTNAPLMEDAIYRSTLDQYRVRQESPEYIEQQKRINKIRRIRGDLGLLGR